jgi:hypothetical protein
MIILRQKSYSWDEIKRATKTIGGSAAIGAAIGFGPFKRHSKIGAAIGGTIGAGLGTSAYINGYKDRKRIEKEEPHKKEVDEIIRKNFKWALDYLRELDKKIIQENKKLEELNKKLLAKSVWKITYFYDFLSLPLIFSYYDEDYLSDCVVRFVDNPDVYLTPNEDVAIVYNETTNQLELVDIVYRKTITPIKDISSLRKIIKKYYSDAILDNINYALDHPEDVGIDYGEYSLVYDDPEITEEDYYKALDTYCNEIKKFIKTL